MHELILKRMGFEGKCDHKDRNKLNNQRENLRVATDSENRANVDKHKGFSSFKGVSWDKVNQKWVAQITQHGKAYRLGRFKTEEEAAQAYDLEAKRRFGEFAVLNFKE